MYNISKLMLTVMVALVCPILLPIVVDTEDLGDG